MYKIIRNSKISPHKESSMEAQLCSHTYTVYDYFQTTVAGLSSFNRDIKLVKLKTLTIWPFTAKVF